jgi:hypothetical protein
MLKFKAEDSGRKAKCEVPRAQKDEKTEERRERKDCAGLRAQGA